MSSYTTSKTQAIEDSKKKTSLLKDNSWIRRTDVEDEPVDNFGKTVLSRVKTSETTVSSEPDSGKTTRPASSSVLALSQRFSGSKDDLKTTTPSYYTRRQSSGKTETSSTTTTTTVTKEGTTETTITTTQSVKSPVTNSSTKTETFMERVKSSSKGSQYSDYSPTKTTKPTITSTKDAEDELFNSLTPSYVNIDSPKTDSKTTVTTTEIVTVKGGTDTKTKGKEYDIKSPVSKSTTKTVTSNDAEDKLYDSLIPSAIKDGKSKTTVSSSETVTVKSSYSVDDPKTRTITTKTSSTPVDDLYGSLLPKTITSPSSSSTTVKEIVIVNSKKEEESPSTPSSTRSISYSSYTEDPSYTRNTSYNSDYKYSYSKPDSSYEYSSLNSPSLYSSTTYKSSSLSDEYLSDPIYSKSSTKTVYQSPDRPVLEKDLCTSCRKPFTGDAKMILDDIKINCHASCFKCDICNSSLSYMKAGDSMWIYKRKVHCESCFESTRDKWRR